MPTPEVLSGMRAPRTVRLEEARQRAEASAAAPESTQARVSPAATPAVTVYRSRYFRYRVQVTAPSTLSDPVTGQKHVAGREIAAQFDDGVYRNDDPDPEARALIDRTLQSNKYFGKYGALTAHFWLESEMQASIAEARVKSALDTLKAIPADVLEQHIASLRKGTAEDHEVPPPVAPAVGAGSVRPIPPSAE